jgi:glycine cleavage system H protein
MSEIPEELRYSDEHEWVRVEGDTGVVGITAHAVERLGGIVFVELPEVGNRIDADDSFGVVESPKAMADLYAPVSGEIVEVNSALEEHPELVDNDPYGEGWMIKIQMDNAEEAGKLKDPEAYAELISED